MHARFRNNEPFKSLINFNLDNDRNLFHSRFTFSSICALQARDDRNKYRKSSKYILRIKRKTKTIE